MASGLVPGAAQARQPSLSNARLSTWLPKTEKKCPCKLQGQFYLVELQVKLVRQEIETRIGQVPAGRATAKSGVAYNADILKHCNR